MLKNLTFGQRVAAGCGCVVLLVIAVIVAAVVAFEAWVSMRTDIERAEAPAAFADSLRAMGRLPDLEGLTVARTDSADGSWVVWDSTRRLTVIGLEHAFRAKLGNVAATADDSTAWRRVRADTMLDAYASAARALEWRSTARTFERWPLARRNILAMPSPRLTSAREAARALVIRGLDRAERRDLAGARADLAAATGLGAQMVRREPGMLGLLVGRAIISSAATGWAHVARGAGDSALAQRADAVRTWAQGRPFRFGEPLAWSPDTALVLAADSSLALGMRGYAMERMIGGWLRRPRGLVFGVPGRLERGLDRIARDTPDPDARAVTEAAAATARRIHAFGLRSLIREFGGPTR